MIRTSAQEIFEEYAQCRQYNASIGLEEKVKEQEDFFIGKQWEGVNAPDMDKPVFNILKRVVNYFIAMLASDNVGISMREFNAKNDSARRALNEALKEQILLVMEENRYSQLTRRMLRDAAVTGDGCIHLYYEPNEEGADGYYGRIGCELIDNTDVYFADPYNPDVNRQPYILIASRRSIEDVKREMGRSGLEPSASMDDSPFEDESASRDKRCTVITKYYMKDGRVWFTKVVREGTVRPPVCMGIKRYPICYMNWERKKGSYHGVSAIEGLIPNQIAINKMAAMAQQFIKQQAFPRVFYNRNKLKGWTGGIKPIAVTGDPNDVIYTDRHSISMSGQVSEYIDKFIGHTKELMGASDAALGNVSPENTSAIIAVQKATAIPLELVRQEYYRFTEDFVRCCIDIMSAYYGRRRMVLEEDGEYTERSVDFSIFDQSRMKLNIDIGAAAYWSEMTATTTLENLYKAGLIDAVEYLEGMPAGTIPNKARMIEQAKKKKETENEKGNEAK